MAELNKNMDTMEQVTEYLFGLRKFGKEPGVVRAGRALEYLGHPENGLNVIHIAGTNGKGSVSAYIGNALIKSGFNTGVFTSPHLVKVNERIRINGIMISDEDFIGYFHQVHKISEQMVSDGYDGLAFFDFVFVMAVLYFANHDTDFVVLETGLGGKSDATAAICKKVMSVITSISFDHTEILGDTLAQIAVEKAGIIAKDTPVVYWRTNDEVAQIIEDAATKCNSKSIAVDKKSFEIHNLTRNRIDFSLRNSYYKKSVFSIGSQGLYQVMNASLALTVIGELNHYLINRRLDEDIIRQAVLATCWEGRMEEVERNVFLDGAHNPDGIECFLETAKSIRQSGTGDNAEQKKGNVYLLFGAVCEKDYELMIEEICNSGCFDGFIITEINNHRALSAEVMSGEFIKHTDKPVYIEKDNEAAFYMGKNMLASGDVLMCAGSLYLVGALKEILERKKQ